MMDEDGYQLSRVDCGVPPTTPACQAGILQGNNTNIPAFRWLDKKTGKLLAGGGAAADSRAAAFGWQWLLRGGTSIGNMFSGDAAKSILTFSKIRTGTPEDKKAARPGYVLADAQPVFLHPRAGAVLRAMCSWRSGRAGSSGARMSSPA